MRSKGPRWALLPAPSLESFADSRPFLVASRGNLESRRTQGVGFRGAPGGSLPHILSECPAPGHHLCGNNPRRIVLTQGTWRLSEDRRPTFLRRALSEWSVLRFRRSERPGLHRDVQSQRYGGLFCAFNVFQRGLPWTSLRGRRNFGRHTAGAEERIRASAKRTPRSPLLILSIVSRSFPPVGLPPALFDGWAAASLSLKSMRLSHKWLRLQV